LSGAPGVTVPETAAGLPAALGPSAGSPRAARVRHRCRGVVAVVCGGVCPHTGTLSHLAPPPPLAGSPERFVGLFANIIATNIIVGLKCGLRLTVTDPGRMIGYSSG
jgi:hypothetical protein